MVYWLIYGEKKGMNRSCFWLQPTARRFAKAPRLQKAHHFADCKGKLWLSAQVAQLFMAHLVEHDRALLVQRLGNFSKCSREQLRFG